MWSLDTWNTPPEEICGNKEYFFQWNLEIPEWIRLQMSRVTHESADERKMFVWKLVENFIRSNINISSDSDMLDDIIYSEVFRVMYTWVLESQFSLDSMSFEDSTIFQILYDSVKRFENEYPEEYQEYSQIWEYIIRFWEIRIDVRNYISVQPKVKQEDIDEVADISLDVLLWWFREGIYTREDVMDVLEWEEWFQENKNNWFSFSDALESFWLWEDLKRDINVILWRELNQTEERNLIDMMRYFLYVESSTGYNVSNYEWVSTAKWYYQYLTWNGKFKREVMEGGRWVRVGDWWANHQESESVRRVWGTNSYETALWHIPSIIIERRNVFSSEIEEIWNPQLQDPRELSADEQTILFLSDLINRPWASSHIPNMLEWDIEAVESLYRLHHTAPDDATELRMLLAARDIYGVEIEVYQSSEKWVVGIVLPGVNITSFFSGLIREINPNTGLSRAEIMSWLESLWNIPFQAGSKIEITRSQEDGVAYILRLNWNNYMQINADKSFVYFG